MKYHYMRNDKLQEPAELGYLKSLHSSGRLFEESPVCEEGAEIWKTLGDFMECEPKASSVTVTNGMEIPLTKYDDYPLLSIEGVMLGISWITIGLSVILGLVIGGEYNGKSGLIAFVSFFISGLLLMAVAKIISLLQELVKANKRN